MRGLILFLCIDFSLIDSRCSHCRATRTAFDMFHVRQLWERPLSHTSWFEQLTRTYLQDAFRALPATTGSKRLCPIPLSNQRLLSQRVSASSSCRPRQFNTHPLSFVSTSARGAVHQRRRGARVDEATTSPSDDSTDNFRVAIFGRPNVGKSTLFNRLVGRHIAITHSSPGVTRDAIQHTATLAGMTFTIIDTAGLEPVQSFLSQPPSPSQLLHSQHPSLSLQQSIQQQTRRTLRDCHIALFLIDARLPITNEDIQYARMVRSEHYTVVPASDGTVHKRKLPVVLIANKVEDGLDRDRLEGLDGVYQLGLGQPIEMSAEHGEGLAQLHNVLDQHMHSLAAERRVVSETELSGDASAGVDMHKPVIQMAIVGRPNTGKSTLLNALLREERALTGPQPGITRDPIRSLLPATSHASYRFHVVDTAGIRGGVIRREGETRVDSEAMRLSMRAIDRANIVVLVLDVSGGTQLGGNGRAGLRGKRNENDVEALLLSKVSDMVSQQDLTIAKRVTDEGRGLVVALNKVDLLSKDDKHDVLSGLRLLLDRTLPQVKDVPLIPLSATTGLHLSTLLPSIVWLYERWTEAVPTTRLTNWLLQLQTYRPHPSYKGKRIRLKFMRQVAARPPTFAVWVGGGKGGHGGSEMEGVSSEWMRMMRGMMAQEFGLEGVNIRVKLRRGEVKDREQRRQQARDRDDKEERERVRQSTIEVQDDEEQTADDDVTEREMEMKADEDRLTEDVDIYEYTLRAADDEELNEEEEGAMDEDEVDADVDDTAIERSPQSDGGRRPRFVPFDQDPNRIAAVATATAASTSAAPYALPPVPGFMSPSPLATATSSSLSFSHYPRRPSRSHLSFLPLPPPPAPSTSLPWTERRVIQQKRTQQRSTAIREKKEQAQFVSAAAWRKWKEREEERRQKYLRRERKIVAGREKKAADKRREHEVVGVEEEEENEAGRTVRDKRHGKSRVRRQFASRAGG